MTVKPGSKALTMDEQFEMYKTFILDCREKGYFTREKSLACIDFTYTSHRTTVQRSYAPVGLAPPESTNVAPTYTNCIVTMLWEDGYDRTPALLFTYNKALKLDVRPKSNRYGWQENFDRGKELCEHFDIDASRIIYLPPGLNKDGKKKQYVGESKEVLRAFLSHYEEEIDEIEDLVVMADGGGSFTVQLEEGGSESILTSEYSIAHHVTMPSAIHQLLSVNDNKFHGVAKKQWRAECKDFSDDPYSSLMLLDKLDGVDPEHIERWFERNFMLNGGKVTLDHFRTLLSEGDATRHEFFRHCLKQYREHKNPGSSAAPGSPKLTTDLDGSYWN